MTANMTAKPVTPEDPGDVIERFANNATRLARLALGNGLTPDEVADELELLASAVRNPASVAEDMSPIATGPTS